MRCWRCSCQPAEVQGFVPLPASIGFWGIDSGIRHAVSGSDYTSVRTGAFMGYRIIAEAAGLRRRSPRRRRRADRRPALVGATWRTCRPRSSTRLRLAAARDDARRRVPAPVRRHDRHGDADRPGPDLRGPPADRPPDPRARAGAAVRRAARGPPDEAGARGDGRADVRLRTPATRPAGWVPTAPTGSSSWCARPGPAAGLFGAKITGGGSGGTVAILGRADAGSAVAEIARRYHEQTGREPYVFAGSSIGACDFGVPTFLFK